MSDVSKNKCLTKNFVNLKKNVRTDLLFLVAASDHYNISNFEIFQSQKTPTQIILRVQFLINRYSYNQTSVSKKSNCLCFECVSLQSENMYCIWFGKWWCYLNTNNRCCFRDQFTTTEVNMARVFNWDVKRRQAAKLNSN